MKNEPSVLEINGVMVKLLATVDLGPEIEGVAKEYGPGLGWPEDKNTMHWL